MTFRGAKAATQKVEEEVAAAAIITVAVAEEGEAAVVGDRLLTSRARTSGCGMPKVRPRRMRKTEGKLKVALTIQFFRLFICDI